jgi:hypothetical protein
MLFAVDLPPGVYRNGTQLQSRGRFYDSDLWRWYEGTMRPWGGWREKSATTVSGMARGLLTWRDNDGSSWAGIGTHTNLYAMTRSGVVHDITPAGYTAGEADAALGAGYGAGDYGAGVYGAPREDTNTIIPPTVWSLDTWGENLLAVASTDEVIYEWALDTGTDAAAVANAPECGALVVTEERAVMALGADGNPRAVAWSDLENNTVWTPSSTNLAGEKLLQTNGQVQCAKRVQGAVLIFTDVDAHRARYIGAPLVYDFERLGTACGVISRQCVAAVDGQAFWMGPNGFWWYNGAIQALPSDVGDHVYENLNRTQAGKVYAVHNSQFGEVIWLYPSESSIEVDSYVTYNYRERHWSIGTLDRTCGTDKSVFAYPLMVGTDGQVYEHEVGTLRDGRQPFALTGPVEIGEGEKTYLVRKVIPDENRLADVAVSFKVRFRPMGDETTFGPYTLNQETDVRFSARQASMLFTADADIDFCVGRFRVEIIEAGER